MRIPLKLIATVSALLVACGVPDTPTQPTSVASAAEPELRLFAVEIKVGPNWDSSKSPNEQAFFEEHSSNLKHLREAGHIVMGARYSDIGLIIFSARSAEAVEALMSQDPSMTAGTFKYEVHALNVFYPGLVQSRSSK
ncbi:MAG: YciI family protein [Gammaproteobacteria bacterium]|nr:YciI family protein [Gammaproteobacteria bacterium]MDH3769223.1 YciI family protein [Gammaproteobacteria bacterium]